MKHTQLTTREDRSERGFFMLIGAGVLIILMVISAIATSCTPAKGLNNDDPLLRAGTPEQKERFLECSRNEGDQGCDSCYYLVYGKHIDPFTGNEIK